jgi:hypothetical protein
MTTPSKKKKNEKVTKNDLFFRVVEKEKENKIVVFMNQSSGLKNE